MSPANQEMHWHSAAWAFDGKNDTEFSQEWARTQNRMSTWEFLRRQAAHAFERTTIGFFAEETRIAAAEDEAGTYWDPAEQLGGNDAITYSISDLQTSHPYAMTEEEFKAEGFDRGGRITWTPMTTRQRAAIEAETFDRREWEKKLLSANADTLSRKILGFGAAFLANIPDPVNLVPVFGTASKGASLGTRVLRGAREGMATSALADMAQLPAAARRGDDVEFADFALDIVFGGLIGGGIGTVGGMLHNRRVANLAEEQSRLAELLQDTGYRGIEAGRLAASAITHIADMPLRTELAESVRRSLAGMDRLGAGKLLDRMMIAIRYGENPDVGKWAAELRLLPTISRIEMDNLVHLLQKGAYETVSFGRLSPDKLEALNTIRRKEGVTLLEEDQLVIPANVVKKFYEKRVLKDKYMPDQVAQMLLDVFHLDPDAASSTRYPHIQALICLREELSTLGFIAQNPQNGETVIKSVYKKENRKIAKDLTRVEQGEQTSDSGWGGAESPIGVDDESSLAAPRLSDLQPESNKKNISTTQRPVKFVRRQLDFTAPSPEPEIKPLPLEEAMLTDAKMVDAGDFKALEMEAARLAEEGRMMPKDAVELEAANAELERVENVKNAGLAVLERISGGTE